MKLLTEQEFNQIKQTKNFATYRTAIQKEVTSMSLAMIADAIQKVMAGKLPTDWLAVDDRAKELMYARHYGRYIAYMYTKYSGADITRYFGGRDHTVIYNSLKVIRAIGKTPIDDPRRVEIGAILDLLNQKIK